MPDAVFYSLNYYFLYQWVLKTFFDVLSHARRAFISAFTMNNLIDRDLKHMTRAELIEIIYQYKKETQILSDENQRLSRELDDRRIKIGTAGSIAQAALSLNSVFEAAQAAADQYLRAVKELTAENGINADVERKSAEETDINEEQNSDNTADTDKMIKTCAESGEMMIKRPKKATRRSDGKTDSTSSGSVGKMRKSNMIK